MRAAIYARVSTFDQEPENQLQELRRYVAARGQAAVEYADRGVSGGKDRRPALDEMIRDAKRRRFDMLGFQERSYVSIMPDGPPESSSVRRLSERRPPRVTGAWPDVALRQ